MAAFAKDGGVWKRTVGKPWVHDAGVWKRARKGFVRDAGIWKPLFPPPTFAALPVQTSSGSSTTYSFAGNTETEDRRVVVAVMARRNSAFSLLNATIGASPAAIDPDNVFYPSTRMGGCFIWGAVSAGVPADIVINLNTSPEHIYLACWSVYGSFGVPILSEVSANSSPVSLTFAGEEGDAVLAAAGSNAGGVNFTWGAPLVANGARTQLDGDTTYASAHVSLESAQELIVSASGGSNQRLLIAASWRD